MHILVAAHNYLGVLDTDSEIFETKFNGNFYGLTSNGELYFALQRLSVIGDGTEQHIVVIDQKFEKVDIIKNQNKALVDCHQLVFYDNKIWAVNAANGTLALYDSFDYSLVDVINLDLKTKTNISGRHINSIFFEDNYFYVLAHNSGEPSLIFKYNINDYSLVNYYNTDGFYAHNLWRMYGDLYFCDMVEHAIKRVGDNNIYFSTKEYGHLPRGVAMNNLELCVGLSVLEPVRGYRGRGHGLILVINKKSRNVVNEVLLRNSGQAYELFGLNSDI